MIAYLKSIWNETMITSHEEACTACSYYDDHVVDDTQAFAPIKRSKLGWIAKYVKERLHQQR